MLRTVLYNSIWNASQYIKLKHHGQESVYKPAFYMF